MKRCASINIPAKPHNNPNDISSSPCINFKSYSNSCLYLRSKMMRMMMTTESWSPRSVYIPSLFTNIVSLMVVLIV